MNKEHQLSIIMHHSFLSRQSFIIAMFYLKLDDLCYMRYWIDMWYQNLYEMYILSSCLTLWFNNHLIWSFCLFRKHAPSNRFRYFWRVYKSMLIVQNHCSLEITQSQLRVHYRKSYCDISKLEFKVSF